MTSAQRRWFGLLPLLVLLWSPAGPAATPEPVTMAKNMLIIAHRGASGYRPEHTLEAYALAIEQGADFIEPDLVATRDGVLIARHENELSGTTDVASRPEFAERRTTKRVDGEEVTGWFSEDFTLAEIKRLRARERIPELRPNNRAYDGKFEIPTFAEVIQLAKSAGRPVGVYPETKHPTYFSLEGRRIDGAPIAFSLEYAVIETLVGEGFALSDRVFIQSFEVANLRALAHDIMPAAGVDLPLVQLLGHPDEPPYDLRYHAEHGDDFDAIYGPISPPLRDAAGTLGTYGTLTASNVMRAIVRDYATALGPSKYHVLPLRKGTSRWGGSVAPFAALAREIGLGIHVYTIRKEPAFLIRGPDGEVIPLEQELSMLRQAGVSGVFTDNPDIAADYIRSD